MGRSFSAVATARGVGTDDRHGFILSKPRTPPGGPDEPTALLDPDSQLDLVAAVQRLVKNRGITALWVTHRLDELNYCDGAFLLEKGEVVDRGDPARLKQRLMQSQDV